MYRPQHIPASFAEALEIRVMCRLDATHQQLLQLLNASRAEALTIFRAPSGAPIGYVAFANMDRFTIKATAATGNLPVHGYEWSEGHLCLIHEVVFVPEWTTTCRHLLRSFVAERRAVGYLRNNRVRFSVRSRGRHRAKRLAA